jgi:hypothetical protein
VALSAPLDGPGPGGPPALTEDDSGAYSVAWPQGRPAEFAIRSAFFEQLVEEANLGRRALPVLQAVADALTRLVPSP